MPPLPEWLDGSARLFSRLTHAIRDRAHQLSRTDRLEHDFLHLVIVPQVGGIRLQTFGGEQYDRQFAALIPLADSPAKFAAIHDGHLVVGDKQGGAAIFDLGPCLAAVFVTTT